MGRNHSRPDREASTGEGATGLADDQLYRGLAATERRRVLYALLTDGPATVDELATLLAGWEATTSQRMLTPEDRDRLVTELVHVHLPLLETVGLIVRKEASDTVAAAALTPAVEELILESVRPEPAVDG